MYDDIDGYGGFQIRTNTTDRDSIPMLNRKEGMLVYTQNEQTLWQLGSSLLNTSWTESPFGSVVFGGDLSGNSVSQLVIGLQGRSILNAVPTDGYVLAWSQAGQYWFPESITAITGGLGGIPSNEYGGAGNKLEIGATETIMAYGTGYPASSAAGTITTTDSAWHTILARTPQGPGRWQVAIVGQDGAGNEFSTHLDFHANATSITFPAPPGSIPTPPGYPLINPIYIGSSTSYSAQAIFTSGQVQIQVRNFTGTGGNPVAWGAWLQDLTRM